jgi:hypothetical protein
VSKSWGKEASNLVHVGIALGIGFGVMGYVLATFIQALPSGSQGASFVNSILNAFNSAITNILPAVISIAFIVLLYVVVKKAGLLGGGSED